jgi:hypothetical protein
LRSAGNPISALSQPSIEKEYDMEIEGGCYCGALRYKAVGEPLFKGQCHCRECQYISGGSVNVTMGMPSDGFSYTKGSPKAYSRSDLENPVVREFCAECGTHTVSRPPGMPAALIKVGTLDDPAVFGGPQIAIYLCDRQAYHHVADGVAEFDHTPG